MKLLSGLAIVACHSAYAQSGDGSAETAIDTAASESMESPALRQQRAFSSEANSDYEYYYEQSALGRRKKKKKKKIIFNIPQRPTTTRAPPTTTRAPLPVISNDYNILFGENGAFGSKVSADYRDYDAGSAGVTGNVGSNRWTGFGGDYAYNYDDGFGEITVGSTYGGKGNFEFSAMNQSGDETSMFGTTNINFNETDDADGSWAVSQDAKRWDNDDINKYWEFMHRQWGHQQENRLSRNFAYNADMTSAAALEEPSRWYHVAPENVINNLNRGYLNYQYPSADGKGNPENTHFKFPVDRRAYLQAGRHGHPWGVIPDKEWDLRIEAKTGTGAGTDSTGDGVSASADGKNKFGWYAQPWLWDAENVPGVSDYKLWNGVNYGQRTLIGDSGVTDHNADSQLAITHTFGFIDWKDADKNSFPNTGETGIIPGTTVADSEPNMSDVANGIRFQDVSPARAPWYGRRFDASWELGDSPAHFVFDNVKVHGTGQTPFDTSFSDEVNPVTYLDRTGTNNEYDQAGWQRYYSGYRWFPGIANFKGVGYSTSAPSYSWFTPNMHGANALPETTNQRNDPAKLKCHHCIESASLKWDDKYHTFKLVSAHTVKGANKEHYISEDNLDATTFGTASGHATFSDALNDPAHEDGVDLWKQCFDSLKQRSCEYSSGVCYVEERRVWGYVTQVQAGCQQSQACYMQKYQNFVVEAGRQCWPGDAFGEQHKLATRPDDMRADQWIYNIIKGGLMLANKPAATETRFNDHRLRKFPSHYFSEMENDSTAYLSSLEKSTIDSADKSARKHIDGSGNVIEIREGNNWIDKFHTGYTGILNEDPSAGSGHQMSKATLTDGNYGVGRSGYESSFQTLLNYPDFLNVGKLNNYIYRGGSDTDNGLVKANSAYITADVAHSNQVYGMKISDDRIDAYDIANKGQKYGAGDADILPAEGQAGATALGANGDLDFNGQGGADGSLFAERSQFYQNEANRFASTSPIDDQWRNPDQHNYVRLAGYDTPGTPDTNAEVIDIFRQYNRGNWPSGLDSSISHILETNPTTTQSARYQPIEYKNGLVEASKCHQCCNTDHNCNWNWQPTTKVDWNFAYVWRYQAIEEKSNALGWNKGASDLTTDTSTVMGIGANGRAWDAAITTLSQDLRDHHFNFPPYMANHPENRGNGAVNGGDPSAASPTLMSDSDSTYTVQSGGTHFNWAADP